MTNFKMRKDEILARFNDPVGPDGSGLTIKDIHRPLCIVRHVMESIEKMSGEFCIGRNCLRCADETIQWLFAEYEPPLLENGDGLKPGDWVMVKIFEDGAWVKRQFAFFHNGWFYYLRGGSNFSQLHLYGLLRSEQARLPEEGE